MLAQWSATIRNWAEELMRPFAIPAAGGIMSAILLFGVLSPQLAARTERNHSDVPTGLYTMPALKATGPVAFDLDVIEVELIIDEQGRMVDYVLPEPQRSIVKKHPALQRSIEHSLLFTEFTPATAFGQPTGSKIKVTFQASSIDVRG